MLKSGKYKFLKNSPSQSKKLTKTTKRRTKRVARRKKTRSKRKFTLPIAPIVGLAAGVAPAIPQLTVGNFDGAIDILSRNYVGYSTEKGTFDIMRLQKGLVPLVLGGLVHKFVGGAPLNINRMLSQAGVPIVRI